ncbi:MAG: hypothetical protein ABMA14_14515 [Hyphomonadaceae bacterium]
MASLDSYRDRWIGWVKDPLIASAGLTFDRTPAETIVAPKGMVRVCAWHMDFDERPTCYLDVASAEAARLICENLFEACGWNVDFATAHDDAGVTVVARPY